MSTGQTGVSDVLFGRIRGAVLALLYGHADTSFYARQVARQINASPGVVQQELKKLAAVDLIIRKPSGHQVFYQANQRNPLFPEMQSLVNKTVGIFHVLRSAVEPLSNKITLAFVYGSLARQEEKADSDIDLLVIGNASLDEVLGRFPDAETTLGRTVNPVIYSAAEFKEKLKDGNHFLNAVLRGSKIYLIGDEDELRKMAGIRLAQARGEQRKRSQGPVRNRRAQPR
jgi:predicted nucleotidyltransferase